MLEAINIHKVYNNGAKALTVLRGVGLSINKGKFAAVVGPSGAGKSTLLHVLGGLDDPTQGKVMFAGRDLYQLDDAALSRVRNKKIGFVFQFYHLLSEFTVLENVFMPALISSAGGSVFGGSQQLRKNAEGLLTQVGLVGRMNHFPGQLSGGEKQRVAVARALINKPELLLCDEPTGNLDSKSGNEIISLIRKLNTENQMTVVLVTHNIELAESADNIFHMSDGVLVN